MCLQSDNYRTCFWRRSGQAERLRHIAQQVQQGGGSLMFWVALCGADVRHWWSWKALKWLYDTGMTSSDLYCDHIGRISRVIIVLMDDNSRPHRAHLMNEFLHGNNIARLECPACSPDMNPIDHAWDTLKRAVFLSR